MSQRLVILAGEFPPFAGGIANAAAQLAKTLTALNFPVTVIAPHYGDKDREFDRRQPYRIIRLPLLRLRYVRMLPMTPVILTLVAKEKPDWVIAMRVTREGLPAVAVKGLFKIPFIVFAHALEFLRFSSHSLGWKVCCWVYSKSDWVAAISSATRFELVKRGVEAEKVRVIHLGISEETFEHVPPIREWNGSSFNGRRILLTVGRLVPRKGVDKVLEALPTVIARHPEVLYVVVGDGKYREDLRRLTETLGISDHVLFTGKVPDVRPFYHACDIFVMPARQEGKGDVEGLGLVFLEAAACGKPVIAGAVGGAVDAVVHEVTGLFVDPTNPKEIADAILRLLDDPKLAQRMGEAGRQRVMSEFRWELTAKKLISLMDKRGVN